MIPTKGALLKRGISFNSGGGPLCPFCNNSLESSDHLFASCDISYSVWQLLYNWLNFSIVLPSKPIHHFSTHMGLISNHRLSKFWSVI
ncbi:unnamed protein product [Lupinus luteus]|uniref:Reverse transcriptase zinc-binding domain-containing protein n=1 Tax=Lupinus luteus TaxID=3873 RepID=A0AAV1Y921_LUPLU